MTEDFFCGEELCCAEGIQQLARLSFIMERDIFKEKGFTNPQALLLINLDKTGSLTMNELSKLMAVDLSTATRNVEKLVKKKYLKKEKCTEDRRVSIVSLTDKGRETAISLKELFVKHYASLLCKISEEKRSIVFEAVSILTEAFKNNKNEL